MSASDARPHVLALLKQVPHHATSTELSSDGTLIRDGMERELNPYCRRAAAMAVRLANETGGTSTALTMGPPSARDVLSEVAACGIDRTVLLSDTALAGSDCLATARALAAAIRTLPPPDLIVVGRGSLDADTSVVGPMIAEHLGVPFAGPAIMLDVTLVDGGLVIGATMQHDDAEEQVEVRGPAVIAVAERSIAPAKAAPGTWPNELREVNLSTAELGPGPWGLAGSGTVVAEVRTARSGRRGEQLSGTVRGQVARAVEVLLDRGAFELRDADQAVEATEPPGDADGPAVVAVLDGNDRACRSLLGEAAALAHRVGGHVVAAGPVADASALYRWGADVVLDCGAPAPRPLAAALAELTPRSWAVLAPAGSWGREVLARLAVHLDAGLICDAVNLDVTIGTDGAAPRLTGAKPCGNATVAEIVCSSEVQLATVRTGCLPTRTPRIGSRTEQTARIAVPPESAIRVLTRQELDAHDCLDRADAVIGLGRGVRPEDYGELDALRSMLHAELAATRPVTDARWLPRGRQVGITSRNIAPRLYIAVGISGSGNHTAGVARAHTVLAINSDPAAAIYSAADVGIVADWRRAISELVDELTRRAVATTSSNVRGIYTAGLLGVDVKDGPAGESDARRTAAARDLE